MNNHKMQVVNGRGILYWPAGTLNSFEQWECENGKGAAYVRLDDPVSCTCRKFRLHGTCAHVEEVQSLSEPRK